MITREQIQELQNLTTEANVLATDLAERRFTPERVPHHRDTLKSRLDLVSRTAREMCEQIEESPI